MLRIAALRVTLAAISLTACPTPLTAQFNTPSIDGVIQPGEYGNTQNGTNQIATSTAQTWYMTWDASYLYVGISNANLSEAAVIYIDTNELNPPNGGTGANGNLTGFNYNGEEIGRATGPTRFPPTVRMLLAATSANLPSPGWRSQAVPCPHRSSFSAC
jgi:hypothetical protein